MEKINATDKSSENEQTELYIFSHNESLTYNDAVEIYNIWTIDCNTFDRVVHLLVCTCEEAYILLYAKQEEVINSYSAQTQFTCRLIDIAESHGIL